MNAHQNSISAAGKTFSVLNGEIRGMLSAGHKKIIVNDMCGQRYLADGLRGENISLVINGTPGNDLAAFLDGPEVVVFGNAQEGIGNTMNAGQVIIHGNAGDIAGHSMRGGRIFIKGNAGYRVGIHMKAYKNLFPVVIIGGCAGAFLGEYMAGGLLIVLGLSGKDSGRPKPAFLQEHIDDTRIIGDFAGTGMHGGQIFIRGEIAGCYLGREVKTGSPSSDDIKLLTRHLNDFCGYFELDINEILKIPFVKLYPYSHRPYGRLYAY